MYAVYRNGEILTYVLTPLYIYRHERGFNVLCEEGKAQGIVVEGVPYSLVGRKLIENTEVVAISPVNGGKIIFDTSNKSNDQNELAIDHEYRLTLIELGVNE